MYVYGGWAPIQMCVIVSMVVFYVLTVKGIIKRKNSKSKKKKSKKEAEQQNLSVEVRLSLIGICVTILAILIYVNFIIVIVISAQQHTSEWFFIELGFRIADLFSISNLYFLLIFSTSVRHAFLEFISCGKFSAENNKVMPFSVKKP